DELAGHCLDSRSSRDPFDASSYFAYLVDIPKHRLYDEGTGARFRLDESVDLELCKCVPDGSSGNIELCCDCGRIHSCTWQELTGNNAIPNDAIQLIGDRFGM